MFGFCTDEEVLDLIKDFVLCWVPLDDQETSNASYLKAISGR